MVMGGHRNISCPVGRRMGFQSVSSKSNLLKGVHIYMYTQMPTTNYRHPMKLVSVFLPAVIQQKHKNNNGVPFASLHRPDSSYECTH